MIRASCLGPLLLTLLLLMLSCRSGPPDDLIIRNDHRGLAEWYDREAVQLRSKADNCRQRIRQYEEPSFHPSPKETKQELISQCDTIIKYYTHAADEADALAKIHRQQAGP